MTTLQLRKSYIKNLFVALALFMGWLCTSSTLYAFPALRITNTNQLAPGTIFTTNGLGTPLNPPVSYVTPATLLATGGVPLSGYTWTRSTGSTFPAGTTVDPFTGVFHLISGSSLRDTGGPQNFDMTVSDGYTTAHATFLFTVTTDNNGPPFATPFEQLLRANYPLPNAKSGSGYGASLYAEGGTPPYKNWGLAVGALPPGMVIDLVRGIVRGTPTTSAIGHAYNFQIHVTDSTNTIARNPNGVTYTISVPLVVPPGAPLAAAATNRTSSGFTANWSSVNGATGYRLYISTSSTFTTYVSYNVGAVTSKILSGLSANTIYYYRVSAYDTAGTGPYSNIVSVQTLPLATPLAPTVVAPTRLWGLGFKSNWGGASGATGYLLDIFTNSSLTSYVSGFQNRNVGNALSQSVSGLSANTTYYSRVRAYNGAGVSGNSNVYTTVTNSVVPAAATSPIPGAFSPDGLAFTSSDSNGSTFTSSSVTFSWKAGANATQYWLYVGSTLGMGDIYTASQGLNLSHTVSSIPTDGRTIYVRLWSYINGSWHFFDYPYKALKVSAPNLTPYQPSGWSNKIVTTHTYGSKTDTSSLLATSPIYIDFAVINNGVSNATTAFRTNLYVDGVVRNPFATASLSVNTWTYYIGWSIGRLSHGYHTIKITTDSTNQVSESTESDNTYSKQIFVN